MSLIDLISNARVYDLAHDYFAGMPHHPNHPPFLFGLTKKHGEFRASNGMSSAADSIAFSGHTGTHMDALCHFSCGGNLHGGVAAEEVQSYTAGVRHLSIDTVAPVLRRGVLLDIAGDGALEAESAITPEDLDGACRRQHIEIRPGDIVLLRTGWGAFFENASRYISEVRGPGPELDGAKWLSARKVFAAGSDTVAFERVPSASMPVHVHLLVDSGIHIIENLDLEALARDRVYEFAFIAAPLKIRGGTGSPVRPLALVQQP